MATAERDLYEVLGVPRGAGDAEIKKAFRRLARELHPDVSQAPDAETRFREVAQAYEVLSKPETRQLYNRYGHAGLRGGGYSPGFQSGSLSDLFSAFFGDEGFGGGRAARGRGADLSVEIEIELAQAVIGVKRELAFEAAARCGTCGGNGVEPGKRPVTCPVCAGAGQLQQVSRSPLGQFVRTQACPRCAGAGTLIEDPCETCDGAGQTLERRSLEVSVPPGIHDGQRIRITGEGHAGPPGGRAGDVYVDVAVRADPRFVRDGNDLLSQVDLTITQAALGVTLVVPTIDGEEELEFTPGTQPGEVRVLRARGMPVLQGLGRGDHRVLLNVSVPRKLCEEQRRLLEEFESTADEGTYRAEEGFFDKLKSAFR